MLQARIHMKTQYVIAVIIAITLMIVVGALFGWGTENPSPETEDAPQGIGVPEAVGSAGTVTPVSPLVRSFSSPSNVAVSATPPDFKDHMQRTQVRLQAKGVRLKEKIARNCAGQLDLEMFGARVDRFHVRLRDLIEEAQRTGMPKEKFRALERELGEEEHRSACEIVRDAGVSASCAKVFACEHRLGE